MFTGIVEELGQVKAMVFGAQSVKITIRASKILADLQIGDSIAVNGTCLTAVSFTKQDFTADVMPETVRMTVLSQLSVGDAVNLERALTLSSRLGGHIVSGHVDGLGEIIAMEKDDNAIVFRIKAAEEIARYIVPKGSVTIDGISLTVVECQATWFSVSMIPHTAEVTTLGRKKKGDLVNIENDIVGKYVERLLRFQESSTVQTAKKTMDIEFLTRHGFN